MDEFRSSESALARLLDGLDCLFESSLSPSDKGRFFDFDAIVVVRTYPLLWGHFLLDDEVDDEVDDSNTSYSCTGSRIAITVFVRAATSTLPNNRFLYVR